MTQNVAIAMREVIDNWKYCPLRHEHPHGVVMLDIPTLWSKKDEELRQLARDNLVVLAENSGHGFGLCSVANSMAWSMMRPEKMADDWKSTVAIQAPLDKYAGEELVKILWLAKVITRNYDDLFALRMGANLLVVNKEPGSKTPWYAKRVSWEFGQYWHETLDDLIRFFWRDIERS